MAGGWAWPATFDARQLTEHIVLHLEGGGSTLLPIWIFSLVNDGVDGTVSLKVTALPYPDLEVGTFRVVDIDWDPTQPGPDGDYLFDRVTVATTTDTSGRESAWQTATIGSTEALVHPHEEFGDGMFRTWTVVYQDEPFGGTDVLPSDAPEGLEAFDFTTIEHVHTLFTIEGADFFGNPADDPYRVVLANFASAGAALFVLGPSDGIGTDSFMIHALFPVTLPDEAGVGAILNLQGGTSKFGGFRFVVCDGDGNVFLLRQQRDPDAEGPYPPAIDCQFEDTGSPRTQWSATCRSGWPCHWPPVTTPSRPRGVRTPPADPTSPAGPIPPVGGGGRFGRGRGPK